MKWITKNSRNSSYSKNKCKFLHPHTLFPGIHPILFIMALGLYTGCNLEEPALPETSEYVAPDYFIDTKQADPVKPTCLQTYYISSFAGDDANAGDSEISPWMTLDPIQNQKINPGDCILLECGSLFSQKLDIIDSGTEKHPIYMGSYGTGSPPVIDASNQRNGINLQADWVMLEHITIQNALEAGVTISSEADHNILHHIEVTHSGFGVSIWGTYNHVFHSYFSHLHMIKNDPGGDDDYGAVGIVFFGSNNEASYNVMYSLKAPSYDYGTDGGAFEWYGIAHDNYVHHNWVKNCNGFMEMGGGEAWNNRIAYKCNYR